MMLLLGGSPEFVGACKQVLDESGGTEGVRACGEVTVPDDLWLQIDRVKPDGVVVPAEERWIAAVLALVHVRPNVRFFVSGAVTHEQWDTLDQAGVYVVPADPGRAARAVTGALKRLSPTRFDFEGDGGSPRALAVLHARGEDVDVVEKHLVAVYCVKGGVGKTTVATNLAAAIGLWAKELERTSGKSYRVCCLDFNSDYGNVKKVFGFIEGKLRSVAAFADLSPTSAWESVERSMNRHEPTGVYYLAAPQSPAEREIFTAELAEKILVLCERHFHFVIIDMGVALDRRDAAIVALDRATDILLVTDLKAETVDLLREFVRNEMRQLMDPGKVSLVVNKVRSWWFSPRDVVRYLELPLKDELPYDLEAEKCDGKGSPLVALKRDARFSRAITSLARGVLGTRAFGVEKRSWVRALFGRRKHVAL